MYKQLFRPIYIAVLSLVAGMVFFASFVSATTTVAGPLEVSYDGDTIFAETNLAPGAVIDKNITVKNNGSVAHSFAIATSNVSGDLASKILLSPMVGGAPVWTKTIEELSKLPEQSMTVLGNIDPGQTKTLTMRAVFPINYDDTDQGKNLTFDIVFGTQEAESAAQISGGLATLLGRGTIGAGEGGISSAEESSKPEDKGKNQDGEIKGSQDQGGGLGENVWLLLIVPVVALGAIVAMPSSIIRNIGLPLFSGAVAVVLSNYIDGHIDPTVFWSVLGGEVLVTGGTKIVLGDKHKDWYHARRKKR